MTDEMGHGENLMQEQSIKFNPLGSGMENEEITEYGQSIQFNPLETTIEEQREILDKIISLANNSLPEGTVFLVIEKQYTPISKFYQYDFGRKLIPFEEHMKKHGVAWYHISTMKPEDGKPIFRGRLGVWPEGNEIVARLISTGTYEWNDQAKLVEYLEIPLVENV